MKKYSVIGLMSGTSLDGVDIVLCEFSKQPEKWKYKIIGCETVSYPPDWRSRLQSAEDLPGLDLTLLDRAYGVFLAETVRSYLSNYQTDIDFIASHGHTIFHQPEKQLTLQIGNGAALSAISGYTVISDFRTSDVALGGQGAPLVPAGDQHLFSEYDYCLNLGGIGNISFNENGKRIAFDICPVNMAINTLMQKVNLDIDKDGNKGKSGSVIPGMLMKLNSLEFYQSSGPKSLGKEWFDSIFLPVIDDPDHSLNDLLRTVYEHIALQISKTITKTGNPTVLVTGGGAHNKYLIERIRNNSDAQFIIPAIEIIDYKEALVFAFLGVLRYRNEVNCYASVTGATRDNIGGTIYQGKV